MVPVDSKTRSSSFSASEVGESDVMDTADSILSGPYGEGLSPVRQEFALVAQNVCLPPVLERFVVSRCMISSADALSHSMPNLDALDQLRADGSGPTIMRMWSASPRHGGAHFIVALVPEQVWEDACTLMDAWVDTYGV